MYTLLLLTFFTCKHRDPKEKPTTSGFWGYLNSLACVLLNTHTACGSTKGTFQGHPDRFHSNEPLPSISGEVDGTHLKATAQPFCSAAAGQAGAAAGRSLCCSPPLRREASKQIPATTETPGFALLNAREHGAHRGRSAMPRAGFAQTAREPKAALTAAAQPPSEGWGQAALQISRQQPELNPHSDFTHFSSIIHILKSSGRNEEKLRLFWALSAGQVRAPTASKETVTCNTKTIRNKTLVHNLQEKKHPEIKYKILVILHPNRLQVRGKCKATLDYTK